MTAYHPTEEAGTERLLYLSLEAPSGYASGFRHIRASVVRVAQAHIKTEGRGTQYYDDTTVSGWRNAEWSSNKESGLFVDGLHLHGQMTIGADNRERTPYCNELQFSNYQMREREIMRMANTFKKLSAKRKKLEDAGHVFRDDFASQARALALSLGIKRFIVAKRDATGYDLKIEHDFTVAKLADLEYYTERLVAKAHGE